jgi:hypothetical protein
MLQTIVRYRWLLILVGFLVAVPIAAQTVEKNSGADWLLTQQQSDGSFDSYYHSPLDPTACSVYALHAAGYQIDPTTQQFIEQQAQSYIGYPAKASAIVMAQLLTGHDPRSVGGVDLVAAIIQSYNPTTGMYGENLYENSLVMMALKAAGEAIEPQAIQTILDQQLADGSWNTSTQNTALQIQALVAADQKQSAAIPAALAFLQTQQDVDRGFIGNRNFPPSAFKDAISTSLAIQAILATGGDPKAEPWGDNINNPVNALRRLQLADGGFRRDSSTPQPDTMSTCSAVQAVLQKTYPFIELDKIGITLTPTLAPVDGSTAIPVQQPGLPRVLPETSSSSNLALPIILGVLAVCVLVGLRLRKLA